jgi:hypothetical protein
VAAFTGLNSSTRFTTDLLAEGCVDDDDDDDDGDHIIMDVVKDDG